MVTTVCGKLECDCIRFCCATESAGANLNLIHLEQLPVIASGDYNRQFGKKTAREIVQDHVLRLTYTSHDMEPFARDLGYNGPPFKWDQKSAATCAPV